MGDGFICVVDFKQPRTYFKIESDSGVEEIQVNGHGTAKEKRHKAVEYAKGLVPAGRLLVTEHRNVKDLSKPGKRVGKALVDRKGVGEELVGMRCAVRFPEGDRKGTAAKNNEATLEEGL